jgi:hypothetical protein
MTCKLKHRWYTPLAISSIILISLAGCGFKDHPVPPQQVIPLPISDLSYKLDESGVTLSWSYPSRTVTSRDIVDISSFKIYRAVMSPDDYCSTCPVPFAAPLIIPGHASPDKDQKQKKVVYKASLLRPGNIYLFKVRSMGGWWAESKDSNIVSFYWQIPPMAPTKLTAIPKDSGITLSWQPTVSKLDNSPISGTIQYQVYRSVDDNRFRPRGQPLTETSFIDNDTINHKEYFYKVQALSVYPEGVVGGGKTGSISASSIDLAPPPVPAGIRVISTGGGVRIFWEPVKAVDLQKYLVYRRSCGEKTAKLIGTVNAPFAMYMDSEISEKSRLDSVIFYSVSSVDNSTPGNESRRSAEIEVRR